MARKCRWTISLPMLCKMAAHCTQQITSMWLKCEMMLWKIHFTNKSSCWWELLSSVFFLLFVDVIFLLARYRYFVPKMNLDLRLLLQSFVAAVVVVVIECLRSSRHRLLVETAQFQCLWLSCMSDWRLHRVSNNTSFAHRRVLFRSLRRVVLDGASE